VATSTREVLWVESVVLQAFARNAPAIIVADVYPKSGRADARTALRNCR
jgi:methylamine--corrinoid protein Co-methyltransferase